MPTETIKIGADDVDEDVTGGILDATGNDITLGLVGEMEMSEQHDGGFRFQDVSIPTGATIDVATLTLYNSNSGQGLPVVVIKIDDVDDAAAWGEFDMPTGISAFGSASLDFNPDEVGEPGSQWTADVKSLVQNNLNRAGWAKENALRFWADSSGSASDEYRTCGTYENGTKATLAITYSFPPKDSALSWNVQKGIPSDSALIWNVQKAIATDLDLGWNVYVSIDAPTDLALSWDALKAVGSELRSVWNLDSFSGSITEGMAFIHGPTRPSIKPKHARIDIKGQGMTIKLGKLTARVDAVALTSVAKARALSGKFYAFGDVLATKQKSIPAKGDEDAILFILSLVDSDG
jgi:hypothetical protein